MTTEAMAMYEDVPHALECADTIYRRLQRVIATGGATACSAARLARADQLVGAARIRAAKTHGRASREDRRAIERLIFDAEVERERLVVATQRAARDLGWDNDSLTKTIPLLVQSREDRRRALSARLTVEKLELAFWPLAVIGLAGLATSLLRGPVVDYGVQLATQSLPLTIGLGVAILALMPVGVRPRAVAATLAATVIGFVLTLLSSFSGSF